MPGAVWWIPRLLHDLSGLSFGKYGTIVYSGHAGLLASAVGRGEAMTVMRSTNHETRSSADRNASDPDCLAASASTKESTPEANLFRCQLASYPDPWADPESRFPLRGPRNSPIVV